ncbi:hypothetical protein GGR09_001029 [Bartonella heixiaziensis]
MDKKSLCHRARIALFKIRWFGYPNYFKDCFAGDLQNYESYKTDGDDNEKCCKCNHASTRSAPFCFTGIPLLWQTALYVYE